MVPPKPSKTKTLNIMQLYLINFHHGNMCSLLLKSACLIDSFSFNAICSLLVANSSILTSHTR